MLRFSAMTAPTRVLLACALLLAAAVPADQAARAATAAEMGITTLDSGRLVVYDHGKVVGVEEFQFDRGGDSLLVSATHTRMVRSPEGQQEKWEKKFGLVMGASDFDVHSYTSNIAFAGHVRVRGIVPGDTAMTVYSEVDGAGDAIRIPQPPGRWFVMDPMLFTLFDVICRNLSAQGLSRRPIELVTLGDEPGSNEATASAAGQDTVRWGGHRLVARRWTLEDPSGRFTMWASPKGYLLRLVHEASGLEVMREEPKPAPKPKSAKPAKPPAAPAKPSKP